MDDQKLKNLLQRNLPELKSPEREWYQIEEMILKRKFSFKILFPILVTACLVIILSTNIYRQKVRSDRLLGEYLLESSYYLSYSSEEDENYFY